jgi:hypothetical protein
MFGTQLLIGALMISISVVFHVAAMIYLTELLKKAIGWMADFQRVPRIMTLMVMTVLIIIGVHTVEAWTWAALYLNLGEFSELEDALYFSVITATTLGYGDITLSADWHILGTFEAMGGLILFGVSTAFLLELMRHLFADSEA